MTLVDSLEIVIRGNRSKEYVQLHTATKAMPRMASQKETLDRRLQEDLSIEMYQR